MLCISDNCCDGTLINEEKILTAKTQEAVKKLHQANILFTVTIARPPFGLGMIINTLELISEIVTIGDNYNDIAMGNASEKVQAQATYLTTSNSEEGFANAMERFVLNA